jgi:hypothetical protein
MGAVDIASAIHVVMACIDMCVFILAMHTSTTEARKARIAHRKRLRRVDTNDWATMSHNTLGQHEPEEDALERAHVKQIFDLISWHIVNLSAK